jgi:hypothetical protein
MDSADATLADGSSFARVPRLIVLRMGLGCRTGSTCARA